MASTRIKTEYVELPAHKKLMTREERLANVHRLYPEEAGLVHLRYNSVPMPGRGSVFPHVMFVGESARQEDRSKWGMVMGGIQNRVLADLLLSVDLREDDAWITTAMRYPLPKDRSPTDQELAGCIRYVELDRRIVRPNLVFVFGRRLNHFMFGIDVVHEHGKTIEYQGVRFVPMFSPLTIAANQEVQRASFRDMRMYLAEVGKK